MTNLWQTERYIGRIVACQKKHRNTDPRWSPTGGTRSNHSTICKVVIARRLLDNDELVANREEHRANRGLPEETPKHIVFCDPLG